jgi:GT2 family glycosyltransferase
VISVVTLTKDRPDLFLGLAENLRDASPQVEKIVVQNGTDQETVDIAKEHGFTIIDDGVNHSFSVGNNKAVERATGEFVLLLNNDARIKPGTLDLFEELARHPRINLVGSFILDTVGKVNHAGGGFFHKNMMPVHYGRKSDPDSHVSDRWVPWVTFACVLIRRSLYQELGGLSEEYYYSYEDVDFCLRALERGIQSLVPRNAVVVHNEGTTRDPFTCDPKNATVFHNKWVQTRRILHALGIALEG